MPEMAENAIFFSLIISELRKHLSAVGRGSLEGFPGGVLDPHIHRKIGHLPLVCALSAPSSPWSAGLYWLRWSIFRVCAFKPFQDFRDFVPHALVVRVVAHKDRQGK